MILEISLSGGGDEATMIPLGFLLLGGYLPPVVACIRQVCCKSRGTYMLCANLNLELGNITVKLPKRFPLNKILTFECSINKIDYGKIPIVS